VGEVSSKRKSCSSVEFALSRDVVSGNRYYLSAIVGVIKCLAVNELSLWGTEENLGSLHSGLFFAADEIFFQER